jgi:hypothetical protein
LAARVTAAVAKRAGHGTVTVSMADDPVGNTAEIWIIPFKKGWGLRLQHEEKPFALFAKKAVAIEHAKRLARSREIELVVLDESEGVETRELIRKPK